ncbi:class I mannose-6-phosphate isomerase [Enterocloster lavalensis]|uniref:class I mannose-6-phosphate isomerase n=1 Tax=Enterocloster lavalensis TaxID=460384 RepID=UPI0034A30663
MSFMFKPLAYDDTQAVNRIALPGGIGRQVLTDSKAIADRLVAAAAGELAAGEGAVLGIDGYIGAQYGELAEAIQESAGRRNILCRIVDMRDLYKPEEEIKRLTADSLPENYEDDPVLLFGRLYRGKIDDFIDESKAEAALEKAAGSLTVLCGSGSCAACLRPYLDKMAYVDVTPKVAAIRAREGRFANIGDREIRPFNLLMRRNYFVDFEVAVKLRKELLQKNLLDFYLLGNENGQYMMMDGAVMDLIFSELVRYPFRAKPVYLEGIWGGEFIRKVRHIPEDISGNIAWIFEFIPMEVSIVVDLEGLRADFPFSTFVQKKGMEMMGRRCVEEFEGYFPIRFNYDDTWHSNGNMSVQVHPDEDYVVEQYDEFGRQDEAYYVIATGHGARTYCGFKGDGREFLELARQSERDGRDIDYKRYIHSLESVPGRQIMLPAGTIHASGRNQLILELGSLTIGSYTYKVYDYNRRDKDGNTRPIHTKNAEKVLRFERDGAWVRENIAIEPVLLKETDQYVEYVVGKTDLMYYETHRIELCTGGVYEGSNHGQFTVVTVVDGEQARISSKSHPEFSYTARFLDVVTIPAIIEDYEIRAEGYQPVVIHKTLLREGYTRYKNPTYKDRTVEKG